jgi:glycosyltransferase involved in cell wall biosynthesis
VSKLKRPEVDVLFVDVLPFRHSTRTRKMALALASNDPSLSVAAFTLQRVGRVGISDLRERYEEAGVSVEQVPVPAPREGTGVAATAVNLGYVYPVGLGRLAWEVLATDAPRLIIGSTSLTWLALLHHRRFGSRVVVNARERFAGIRTKGSLGTLVSRLEPLMISVLAKPWVVVTSVCESHAREFREAGAREVVVIRNAPLLAFIPSHFAPTPGDKPFTVALVGSLYPGRGIEALIEAAGALKRQGLDVRVEITGRASAEYAQSLVTLAATEGVTDLVRFFGPCTPEEVPERYAAAHLGTALYEGVDSANDSLSNKIFECAASGRAVLAGNLSENVALVSRYKLGWTAEVSSQGLSHTLRELMEQDPEFDALGLHCRETAQKILNWETEVRPLFTALER